MVGPLIDLTGTVYQFCTVIRRVPNTVNKSAQAAWLCRCHCGKRFVAMGHALRKQTRTCGCLKGARIAKAHLTIRATNLREWETWCRIRQRCYNPNNDDYPRYGGRGIRVAKRWRGSAGFKHFLSDMSPRPAGHSIERIDVNGHYTPTNCCWATAKQQANNRRSNVFVRYKGRTQTLAQWRRRLGLTRREALRKFNLE